MKILSALPTGLAILLSCRMAYADFVATLEPARPSGGEDVFVHVANTTGLQCFPPHSTITADGNALVLKLWATDSCAVEDYVSERDYPVGAFPEGSYALDVQFCALNPPPFPSGCSLVAHLPFEVTALVQATPVSAMSVPALVALLVAMLLISRKAIALLVDHKLRLGPPRP